MEKEEKMLPDKVVESFADNENRWTKAYSAKGLIEKITRNAKKVGATSVYYALLLYYSLRSERISLVDKALVIAALGYFIAPVDFIPDLAPFGLLDDTSVLLYALGKIGKAIDAETEDMAKEKLKTWFNDSEIFELSKEDVSNTLRLKNSVKTPLKLLKRFAKR